MKNIFRISVAILLIFLIHSCKKNDDKIIKDGDGNVYTSVTIGTQIWMKENLKTTKYNDGTSIPIVTDNTSWSNLTSPGYCWYENDEATYKNMYGGLYNWYTINTGKLCPKSWHIPSNAEWITLTTYLGGESVAGGKLKETGTVHWSSPNAGATNETGFTALPGGSRYGIGLFGSIAIGWWWSATEDNTTDALCWAMDYSNSLCAESIIYKKCGYSVRCIKDN